ncbi:MAG TPA: hypothetical protein VKK81_16460 [Candidatus Binatia bacterium]|nr:hypothetical protein [Candidatus Binatia bacterium]
MATKANLRVLPTPQGKSRLILVKGKPEAAKSRPQVVKSRREEAAPTFPTWRQRWEEMAQALRQEVEQFLGMVKVLGTPVMRVLRRRPAGTAGTVKERQTEQL